MQIFHGDSEDLNVVNIFYDFIWHQTLQAADEVVEREADFVEAEGVVDLLEEGAVVGVVPREVAAAAEEEEHRAVVVVVVGAAEE